MRLGQVFAATPPEMLCRAGVSDGWPQFVETVDARDSSPAASRLVAEVASLAADLDAQAETETTPLAAGADPPGPPIAAGQQAYVDYRLGVVAKVDALSRCRPPAFYGLADYDLFQSHHLVSRTDLPAVAESKSDRLTLRFHPGARNHGRKDLRWVPPPDAKALARIRADLRGLITLTARHVAAFDPGAARRHLDEVWADYEFAQQRAGHAAEFNVLWTVRTFRRLGYRVPLLSLGELWASPWMLGVMAATLVPFVHDNETFVETANAAIRRAGPGEAGMSERPPGHLPLTLTDPATGVRSGLRVERRARDHIVRSAGPIPFERRIGGASEGDLLEFLHDHRGRCTPNVFAPVFLFRAGVGGLVSGRGSIKYSLVVAQVMERLFGVPHPPDLLCAGDHSAKDPFAAARAAHLASPAGLEPTLLSRLLAVGARRVRTEVAQVWR